MNYITYTLRRLFFIPNVGNTVIAIYNDDSYYFVIQTRNDKQTKTKKWDSSERSYI